jgi:hypothetical protein
VGVELGLLLLGIVADQVHALDAATEKKGFGESRTRQDLWETNTC